MKLAAIALLVLGAVPVAPAPAQDVEVPAVDAPAAKPDITVQGERDPKQRKVCTRETATGSVLVKRTCRTVAQIEQEQAEAERNLERMQRDQETAEQVRQLCELEACKK